MTDSPRIAILASGRGSNMEAIADAHARGDFGGELALVLSNIAGAAVLAKAASRGIEASCIPHRDYADRESFEQAMVSCLHDNGINFVVLAGFMRILTETFIREYYGSLLNIHPSLLPKYPGLNTHQRALDAHDRQTGATVHFVTPELDAGPPVIQAATAIRPGDDAASLGERVQVLEHQIYPLAIGWCLEQRVQLRDGRAWKDGAPLGECGYRYMAERENGGEHADSNGA